MHKQIMPGENKTHGNKLVRRNNMQKGFVLPDFEYLSKIPHIFPNTEKIGI